MKTTTFFGAALATLTLAISLAAATALAEEAQTSPEEARAWEMLERAEEAIYGERASRNFPTTSSQRSRILVYSTAVRMYATGEYAVSALLAEISMTPNTERLENLQEELRRLFRALPFDQRAGLVDTIGVINELVGVSQRTLARSVPPTR